LIVREKPLDRYIAPFRPHYMNYQYQILALGNILETRKAPKISRSCVSVAKSDWRTLDVTQPAIRTRKHHGRHHIDWYSFPSWLENGRSVL